ncbi:hypothetical protein B0H66DRAFT_71912 [Apodospora peruviana]|uniref:Uncharacterized protein n=1 Tax=Apodospora peruviana TaxID=516989 RepID=A0AAE0MH12_9PEZI|nr:hypothetical protein B0H66DRAFT_71912 [Apodospora peruviana]
MATILKQQKLGPELQYFVWDCSIASDRRWPMGMKLEQVCIHKAILVTRNKMQALQIPLTSRFRPATMLDRLENCREATIWVRSSQRRSISWVAGELCSSVVISVYMRSLLLRARRRNIQCWMISVSARVLWPLFSLFLLVSIGVGHKASMHFNARIYKRASLHDMQAGQYPKIKRKAPRVVHLFFSSYLFSFWLLVRCIDQPEMISESWVSCFLPVSQPSLLHMTPFLVFVGY